VGYGVEKQRNENEVIWMRRKWHFSKNRHCLVSIRVWFQDFRGQQFVDAPKEHHLITKHATKMWQAKQHICIKTHNRVMKGNRGTSRSTSTTNWVLTKLLRICIAESHFNKWCWEGCQSGSSSKNICLANMRPWVQTPVPPTKINKWCWENWIPTLRKWK
jgi:hypothetical protein